MQNRVHEGAVISLSFFSHTVEGGEGRGGIYTFNDI